MTDVLLLPDRRVAQAAQKAFPIFQIPTAVAVAIAETKTGPDLLVNAYAVGTNGPTTTAPGSHDKGGWQINDYYHPELFRQYDWRDIDQNALMARAVYNESAPSHGGDGWKAWSTYYHSSQLPFLARGRAATVLLFPYALQRYLRNTGGTLLHGPDVAQLQRALAMVTIDGAFGSGTERAVKAFQSEHRLTADGVVGPNTTRALHWTFSA